jgi:hypothetical protein
MQKYRKRVTKFLEVTVVLRKGQAKPYGKVSNKGKKQISEPCQVLRKKRRIQLTF